TEDSNLFIPSIKWQKIDTWLKSVPKLNMLATVNFNFWDKRQKCVIHNDQPMVSTIKDDETVVELVQNDDIVTVIFHYETRSYATDTLKCTLIIDLLNNEQMESELHMTKTTLDNLVLVCDNKDNDDQELKILEDQDDFEQPVEAFLSLNSKQERIVNFCIAIVLSVIEYGQESIKIQQVYNQQATMKDVLKLETDEYLANTETMEVIDPNICYSNILPPNKTKFFRLKQSQTCLVSLENPKDEKLLKIEQNNVRTTQYVKRFIQYSILEHVYQQFNLSDDQYLLFDTDFIPAKNTQLCALLTNSSMMTTDLQEIAISFTVINQNYKATVIVKNKDGDERKFSCSKLLTIQRLCQISCLLFNENVEYYRLDFDHCNTDETDTLDDLDDNDAIEFEFEFVCIATVKCSIEFDGKTLEYPCHLKTRIDDLFQKATGQFKIVQNSSTYSFFIIDKDDEYSQIDLNDSIEDFLDNENSTTLQFRIKETK
ncbi:unnamed protein product, partial [Didymodactylos carnosus]